MIADLLSDSPVVCMKGAMVMTATSRQSSYLCADSKSIVVSGSRVSAPRIDAQKRGRSFLRISSMTRSIPSDTFRQAASLSLHRATALPSLGKA